MNLAALLPSSWKEYIRRRSGAVTMRARIENLRRLGYDPAKIIDAGAYRGEWATMIADIFPNAELLLIEPQRHLHPVLDSICRKLPNARHRTVLLGSHQGHARFFSDESNSRIVNSAEEWPSSRISIIPMQTLHSLAMREDFMDCSFLKLDLQGHELDALAGAGDLLDSIEVILMEVSWLPIGGVPIAADAIGTMAARGFRLYDVMGFNYRPLDHALWQTDLLFVQEGSPLLARQHEWS